MEDTSVSQALSNMASIAQMMCFDAESKTWETCRRAIDLVYKNWEAKTLSQDDIVRCNVIENRFRKDISSEGPMSKGLTEKIYKALNEIKSKCV